MSRAVLDYVECYIKFRGYGLQLTTPQISCIFWFQTCQKYAAVGISGLLSDPKMEKQVVGVGGKIKNLDQLPEFEDCNQVLV